MTLLYQPKHGLPTFETLCELTRWARTVLVARAVRRIQPLYTKSWPQAPAKDLPIIEAPIAAGEASAAIGKTTADLKATAMAAMKIYGKFPEHEQLPEPNRYGREVPFAASRVAFSAGETEPFFAFEGLVDATNIAEDFAKCQQNKDLFKQYLKLLLHELETLQTLCKSGKLKKNTPVTGEILGELWPAGVPQGWPAPEQIKLKPQANKSIDLKELGLPKDLITFLSAGQKLKYRAASTEVGPTKLKPLDHLGLETFEVEQLPASNGKAKAKKAGAIKKVRGVDLVAECDSYGPDGILVWLPDLQCFGQHDPDHVRMVIFPDAKWADIVAKPAKFLDAQWNEFETFGRYLDPATDLKAKKGKS